MRSFIVIILLALKVHADANELVASRTNGAIGNMRELMDKLVDKLVRRAHKELPQYTNLDNGTFAKTYPDTSLATRHSRLLYPGSSSLSPAPRSPFPLSHTMTISHVYGSRIIRSGSDAMKDYSIGSSFRGNAAGASTEADDAADRGASAEGVAGVALAAAAIAAGVATGKPGGKDTKSPKTKRTTKVDTHKISARSGTVLPKVNRATTKGFLKDLKVSDVYHKTSHKQMGQAIKQLQKISGSSLLRKIREEGFRYTIGDVTFVLAESYGFCWGVERSVAMAYEARRHFFDKNIWVTNEIIHNPDVNNKLNELGMKFILKDENGVKDFSVVGEGDVVVLPAFGATVDEMAFLQEKKVQIVDTTCPWVGKVWYMIEKNKDLQHTSIIHGTAGHEETEATSSFADKYLIVRNMEEAEYVADYILNGGDRDAFFEKFKGRHSAGFDPDKDLKKVGVANQTTMLKGETQLIGRLFERIMIQRFGPQEINDHFVAFNTICDATDERQNAMYTMFGKKYQPPEAQYLKKLEAEQGSQELLSDKSYSKLSSKEKEAESRGAGAAVTNDIPIDITLVVGGFNSANTAHLLEIADEQGIPGYHIDNCERIGLPGDDISTGIANQIESKPLSTSPKDAMQGKGLYVTERFLPDGPVVIGITSGASTPDLTVEEALKRILAVKGLVWEGDVEPDIEPPPIEFSEDARAVTSKKPVRPGTPKAGELREGPTVSS